MRSAVLSIAGLSRTGFIERLGKELASRAGITTPEVIHCALTQAVGVKSSGDRSKRSMIITIEQGEIESLGILVKGKPSLSIFSTALTTSRIRVLAPRPRVQKSEGPCQDRKDPHNNREGAEGV